MRRNVVALLVVGLVVGALAPAQAAKKKKPKPKAPVAVDVTYNVGWDGATCVLSTSADLASPDNSCGDPFAGSTTGEVATAAGQSDGVPVTIAAIDGVPLTLDAAKKISGKLVMGSYTLAALAGTPAGVGLGVGEAEWHIVVSGESGGDTVTIGEATTEPYLVSPGDGDHEVTFEITPGADLAGKVFNTLQLSVQQVGSATVHGALITDGSSMTLGAFK